MNTAEKNYQQQCYTRSDINEHLPTLRRYAETCETVVEMGVRGVISTWAFVVAKPKKLICVDIIHPSSVAPIAFDKVVKCCSDQGTEFSFLLGDSRTVDLPPHDLLFIDTLHDYAVVKEELRVQSPKTKSFIVFHDTSLFGNHNESGGIGGTNPAIQEFLANNPVWTISEVFHNNNGLTILVKS